MRTEILNFEIEQAPMATDPHPTKQARARPQPSEPKENRLAQPVSNGQKKVAEPAEPVAEPELLEPVLKRDRPLAVTLLGIANLIVGLSGIGLAFDLWFHGAVYSLVFGGVPLSGVAGTTLNVFAGLALVASLCFVATAVGFWFVQRWSRVLAISVGLAVIVIDLAFSVAAVVVLGMPVLITVSLASMAYALLLVTMMYRKPIVVAFLGEEAAHEYQSRSTVLNEWFSTSPGWISSLAVHALVLLLLGLIYLPSKPKTIPSNLTALKSQEPEEIEQLEPELEDLDIEVEAIDVLETEITADTIDITEALKEPAPAPSLELADISPVEIDVGEVDTGVVGNAASGGFGGRHGMSRQQLVANGGGNQQSEEAVARALNWLQRHQTQAGNWDFQHQRGPCQGKCENAGRIGNALNGATAMGVLPFLGAGQTHEEGSYKKVVKGALAYLLNNQRVNRNGGSFIDGGTFYSHGLASIAICEAYAMTGDKALLLPAQRAIAYIVYAQDVDGGGWRYGVGQQGDTSVVGWQLMALKSGHMGYLDIPQNVIAGVNHFLNTVQDDKGAAYGYASPGDRPSTTAIGLLMRMYLGWEQDNEALKRGVERLSLLGPSDKDMYYNYYATQVLHHYGGEPWDRWNQEMRDYLVETQVRDPSSHEDGSWHFDFGHSTESGGRLYNTSLATMILEVYYRHLPLYGDSVAQDEFK